MKDIQTCDRCEHWLKGEYKQNKVCKECEILEFKQSNFKPIKETPLDCGIRQEEA